MAAHLFRANLMVLLLISLSIPFLLLWKNKSAAIIIQLFLVLSGLEWIRTLINAVQIRITYNEDWIRLAIILGAVALLNFAAIFVFRTSYMIERYQLNNK